MSKLRTSVAAGLLTSASVFFGGCATQGSGERTGQVATNPSPAASAPSVGDVAKKLDKVLIKRRDANGCIEEFWPDGTKASLKPNCDPHANEPN